ncbi:MAG: hypothetical protein ABEK16_03005 [Candidatus Nanohalobium sp.]
MEIELWMVFEAVAATEDAVEDSMEEHLDKLESESGVEIAESNIDETEKIENPTPDLEEGFSKVAECNLEVEGFDKAISLTFNYGPTYVNMEGPEKYELDLKEGQESLQNVANVIHKYAQMGAGGVLVSKSREEVE